MRIRFCGIQLAAHIPCRALKRGGPVALATIAVAVAHTNFGFRAVNQGVALLFSQLRIRCFRVKFQGFRQAFDEFDEIALVRAGVPRLHGFVRRRVWIRNQQVHINFVARTQAVARRAGAVGRVERERARLIFINGQGMAIRARRFLGKQPGGIGIVDKVNGYQAVGKPQRGFHGIGQALFLRGFDLQTVDHNINIVLNLLFQLRRIIELMNFAVDAGARKTLRCQVGK